MKIQKKYQGAIPLNRIANEHNESEVNTYSTQYLNNKLVCASPYQPEDGEEVWIQTSKNLFNINGNVNISGAGGGQTSLNTVSGNVLTSNVNTYSTHNVGQKFTNLKGKTFTVSAKIISNGTGTGGYTGIYDNNTLKTSLTVQAGETVTLTYTGTTDNIVVGFATASGEGAQFTNIQVEIGNTATDYEPYVEKKIYTKNDNGYEEFYNGEEDNYSQEERRIGTWLNGKPLYQKTMVITIKDGITSTQFNLDIPNIDYIYIDSGNSSIKFKDMSFVQLGFYSSATDFSRAYIDGGKTVGGITLGSAYTTGEKTVYLTLKYTKTTD